MSIQYLSLNYAVYLLLLMAYGPETGGFVMTVAAKLLLGGGNQENPNHVNFHLILRATARQLQQSTFLARNPRGNLDIPLGISIPPWPQYISSVLYKWLEG